MGLDRAFELACEADAAGDWDSALALYQDALDGAAASGQPESTAIILRKIGRVHFERGDYDRANQSFESSLLHAQEKKQKQAAAAALNAMAACAQLRGRLDVAESLYARAGVVADAVGDVRLSALIDQNLGTLANTRGDLAAALMRYQSALDRFRSLKDDRALAWVLNNMGMLHTDVGEWAASEVCFDSAQASAESIRDLATVGKIETNRAELHLKRQNFERARECCDRAFEIFSRLGSDSGLGEVYKFYGVLYFETGKLKMANVQLGLALKLARACDNPLLEAETESARARVFLAGREHRLALRSLNRAAEVFSALDVRGEILDVKRRLERMGDVYYLAAEAWVEDGAAHKMLRTGERGRRVAEYALALAKEVKYPDVMWLRLGAYLRDIGNASVPREILDKPGPLTDSERAVVRRHVIVGDQILEELAFPEVIRPMVRNHHERWDGQGYPDRLRGEDIPVSARIVCIADVFDALTTDCSYRNAYQVERALDIMENESGRMLDPFMFRQFKEIIVRHGHQLNANV